MQQQKTKTGRKDIQQTEKVHRYPLQNLLVHKTPSLFWFLNVLSFPYQTFPASSVFLPACITLLFFITFISFHSPCFCGSQQERERNREETYVAIAIMRAYYVSSTLQPTFHDWSHLIISPNPMRLVLLVLFHR